MWGLNKTSSPCITESGCVEMSPGARYIYFPQPKLATQSCVRERCCESSAQTRGVQSFRAVRRCHRYSHCLLWLSRGSNCLEECANRPANETAAGGCVSNYSPQTWMAADEASVPLPPYFCRYLASSPTQCQSSPPPSIVLLSATCCCGCVQRRRSFWEEEWVHRRLGCLRCT